MPYRREQEALLRVARNNGRTAIPAFANPVSRVQLQAAAEFLGLHRLGRMALIAFLHENRADLRLEECDLLVRVLRTGRHLKAEHGHDHDCRAKSRRIAHR